MTGESGESGIAANPVLLVILLMMLGATVFLWQARYLRRKTAIVLAVVLSISLIAAGLSIYTSGG